MVECLVWRHCGGFYRLSAGLWTVLHQRGMEDYLLFLVFIQNK